MCYVNPIKGQCPLYSVYIFRDSKMWKGLCLYVQRDRHQLSPEKRALCATLTSSNGYPYCMASVVLYPFVATT